MLTDTPTEAWRERRDAPSLQEVFRSIAVPSGRSPFRRSLAFVGPGYLVAVGYMNPGNWATSLAGGAKFGYALLFIALLSNIMAILLQSLCARLAVASGRDLARLGAGLPRCLPARGVAAAVGLCRVGHHRH